MRTKNADGTRSRKDAKRSAAETNRGGRRPREDVDRCHVVLTGDLSRKIRMLAESECRPFSHQVEFLLRKALGLPAAAS